MCTSFSPSLWPQPNSQTLAKGFRRFIGHEVAHHVIARSCQLMSYGFPCQDCIVPALRQLALVKTLGCGLEAQGKLYCLHIGPRQIRIAIFDIARPFALAIAELRTVHTAAIRGVVPHGGKAADGTGFQADRLGQDRPNARHSEQLLVRRRVVDLLLSRGLRAPATRVREAMITQVLHCPYCQGIDIVKHGLSPEG
jgi:hypothetical protein